MSPAAQPDRRENEPADAAGEDLVDLFVVAAPLGFSAPARRGRRNIDHGARLVVFGEYPKIAGECRNAVVVFLRHLWDGRPGLKTGTRAKKRAPAALEIALGDN